MQLAVKTRQITLINTVLSVFAFSFLQALSAQVKIPLFFTPVPVTMQTFVVLMSIIMLKQRAVFAQALYITLGALGAPFFSSGGGTACLLGPTAGYIFGFFAVSLAFPFILNRNQGQNLSFSFIFTCLFSALSVIYFFGLIWLKLFVGLSWQNALFFGVLPFIPGAAFKLVLASFAGYYYLKRK